MDIPGDDLWKWAITRIEAFPPIPVANLLALVIVALIITLLWRVAWRSNGSAHIPDQHADPISHTEAAPTMVQYLFDLAREMNSVSRDQQEILRMMRAPDGGSYLHRINDGIVNMNRLLRKRDSVRKQGK